MLEAVVYKIYGLGKAGGHFIIPLEQQEPTRGCALFPFAVLKRFLGVSVLDYYLLPSALTFNKACVPYSLSFLNPVSAVLSFVCNVP